ncbi:MAG: endonuclease/exonuclease/phosphatase family protein [Candidatus Paceibacterota bacterium]
MKLVSLNIERSKHLDIIETFIKKIDPDVLCLQEVMERDILHIKEITNTVDCFFVPMTKYIEEGPDEIFGVAIFSKTKIQNPVAEYYSGTSSTLKEFDAKNHLDTMYRVFITGEVQKNNQVYRLGTTHFTWTPDALSGEIDLAQKRDMEILLPILKKMGEMVFAGDFNVSRGNPVFSLLAESFRDEVPLKYTASIDGKIHRAGPMELMVDGMFTTPRYSAVNVEMVCGVSDHCALVADIVKIG